jgi:hypothetical protein
MKEQVGVVVAQVGPVMSFGWGQEEEQVPGALVSLPSPSGLAPRPVRPVFAVRPGHAGELVILAGAHNADRARRFLHRTGDGRTRQLIADVDAERVTSWTVVDFRPAPDGGIFLLELLRRGDAPDEWVNRVRRIDRSGTTTWQRTGAFDVHYTDPAHLIGAYSGLQHPALGGLLWVIPRATTAGITALDPATAEPRAIHRLTVDAANLVITPAGHALYARMVENDGQRSQMLADTDLTTGHTILTQPDPPIPLIDLAGLDDAGHLYSRTGDGMARVTPHWRAHLHGAVYDPKTATTTIASASGRPDRLLITQHQPRRRPDTPSPTRTWELPTGHLNARSITLIDLEPGPRFVLYLNGSPHTPKTITTLAPDGTIISTTNPTKDNNTELTDRENRLDLTQTTITPNGAIVIPLANPHGYHLIHLQPG